MKIMQIQLNNNLMSRGIRSISYVLLCCSFLLGSINANGQRSTRRQDQRKVIDLQALEVKVVEHYKGYQFKEAKTDLETLMRAYRGKREAIPPRLQELEDRISLAERLLPRTEQKMPDCVWTIPMQQLSQALSQLAPQIARVIRPRYEEHQLVGIDYMSPITGIGILSELAKGDVTKNYNLIQLESRDTRDNKVEETLLPSDINTPEDECFAYILPDGVSLILGRKSYKGLGGYDLYLSRYHNERQTYLEPTHLGMPFNSPANDYLLAYDDDSDRTILISDRMCPPDSLRVYLWTGQVRVLAQSSSEDDLGSISLDTVSLKTKAYLDVPDRLDILQSFILSPKDPINTSSYRVQYGFDAPTTELSRPLVTEALHLYNALTSKQQEQKRIRQSYRYNKGNREELGARLIALEQEIDKLSEEYKTLSKRIRMLESKRTNLDNHE